MTGAQSFKKVVWWRRNVRAKFRKCGAWFQKLWFIVSSRFKVKNKIDLKNKNILFHSNLRRTVWKNFRNQIEARIKNIEKKLSEHDDKWFSDLFYILPTLKKKSPRCRSYKVFLFYHMKIENQIHYKSISCSCSTITKPDITKSHCVKYGNFT